MKKLIVLSIMVFGLIFNTGCSVFGIRSEESPKYTVVSQDDDKEIRLYDSYIIASVEVEGEYKECQTKAFKILAGYIFGDNIKKQKISMTAPVTQEQSSQKISMTAPVIVSSADFDDNNNSQKISMTAPVTYFNKQGKWVMSFSMPSKYKIEDLPLPKDERIKFSTVPQKYVAAIQYSWYESQELNSQKADELLAWLQEYKSYNVVSKPVFAGYDPPWTLPFFRKNEILIDLVKLTN